MASKVEKQINITLGNSLKELQNLNKAIEKLFGQMSAYGAKLDNLTKVQEAASKAAKRRACVIGEETAAQKKQTAALNEQRIAWKHLREEEGRQRAVKRERQTFWSQAPGLREIWTQYKPTAQLTRGIKSLRGKADVLFGEAGGLDNEILALQQKQAAGRPGKAYDERQAKLNELLGKRSALMQRGEAAEAAAGKASAALAVLNAAAKVGNMIWSGVKDTFRAATGMSFGIKENFREILADVSKITDMYKGMATYATGTSLITNAAARQTQLQYGLTAGQAYAFDQTQQILGIQSDEDLLYMNQSQRAVFRQMMQKQQEWYTQLESSGVLRSIQLLQLDFAMFKQEMAVDIMKWFGENKGTLMSIMKASLTVLKALLQAVGSILTFFGANTWVNTYGAGSSILSDTVAAANTTSINKNVNMTMTSNATGVLSDQDALQAFMEQAMERAVRKTITEIQ